MMEALCIGHAAWDISVWVPDYPRENSKCEVRELVECSGGPAANAACLLAKWGVRTAFAGPLGRDAAGDRIVAAMEGFGVETRLTSRFGSWPTPVSIITVNESNGSRTIVNRRAAEAGRVDLAFAPVESGTAPRLLLFDGHELAASIAAMERWPDALTMLDAGSLREGTRVLAGRVGFLAASERFVSQLLGLDNLRDRRAWPRAIGALHEINGNPVVITLGENGLIAGTADSWFHLPAFKTSPVDTTGAGDIFHGALAYSLLREMDQQEGLRMASGAAALSVRHRGSSASIPSLEEAHRFLASAPRLAADPAADTISG